MTSDIAVAPIALLQLRDVAGEGVGAAPNLIGASLLSGSPRLDRQLAQAGKRVSDEGLEPFPIDGDLRLPLGGDGAIPAPGVRNKPGVFRTKLALGFLTARGGGLQPAQAIDFILKNFDGVRDREPSLSE
jgi:hypothetical protein